MTELVDIANRAFQDIGTRTTITAADLANPTSNEAKQFNLIYANMRDDLSRMAPWDCTTATKNLTYITSIAGTPENQSAGTALWQPGQPSPPWTYEYQYPVDCLKALWINPAYQTGFSGNGQAPITPVVTGGANPFWRGPPVKYKIQTDNFYAVSGAVVANGGTGYVPGEVITLAGTVQGSAPIGAPVQLLVLTAPGGVVATVSVVSQVIDTPAAAPIGGSYFAIQANPVAQGSTTGAGAGATFTLTQAALQTPQRVILTNQEFATLIYVKRIEDPNLMDTLFQSAWINLISSALSFQLNGDKALANMKVVEANRAIEEARKADGNEGLTVNDVTPDWIRARGYIGIDTVGGPYSSGLDWGGFYPQY